MSDFVKKVQQFKEVAIMGATYAQKIDGLDTGAWTNFGHGVRALKALLPWQGMDITFIESDSEGYFPSKDTAGSTHYRMKGIDQTFLCVQGTAFFEIDGVSTNLKPMQMITAPRGSVIRVAYFNCKGLFITVPGNSSEDQIEFL